MSVAAARAISPLQEAGDLGEHHLSALQVGEAIRVVGREHLPFHVPALQHEGGNCLVAASICFSRRSRASPSTNTRPRDGPDSSSVSSNPASAAARLHQRVLDHGQAGVSLAQRSPELGDVGHGQAAVFGEQQGGRTLRSGV